MVKLTYVEASGAEHVIEAKPGQSVMESAVKNNVPGIAADCGGSCACATCRVYVNEAWQQKLGPPSELEQSMIESDTWLTLNFGMVACFYWFVR